VIGMMDQATLLRASAIIEWVAVVLLGFGLPALWLACRRMPMAEAARDTPDEPLSVGEIGCLLLVLCGALILRLLWWDQGIPGTIFGGEIITARADVALQKGALWTQWWHLLRTSQPSSWLYDSAVIQPIVVLFQRVFPPTIHGIVRVGAFFGAAAVALAWVTGRLLHGRRFGLLLAGFVAVSPLQVVWSRLGYRAMAAVPHVLLAMGLGLLAARRKSYALAALAGVVSYASLYNYEAARVAIPLAVVAIWAAPSGRGIRGAVTLSLVLLAVVATLAVTVPEVSLKDALWPNYPGYAGNQGEKDLSEFVRSNYERVKLQGQQSLRDYFLVHRSGQSENAIWTPGIQNGGLVFLPVVMLGVIGLLAVVFSPSRQLIWLIVLLLGLAMPALGCSTARRLLVFDLGWCAVAAIGMAQVMRMRVFSRVPFGYRALLAAGGFGLLGAWTLIAMLSLREPPGYHGVHAIPFATGCLEDMVSCPRCAEAGEGWEEDIKRGNLVILLDSDLARENPTGPAGLSLYGYLAAAAADARDRFQELYPILWNYNFIPEFRHYYPDGDLGAFFHSLLGKIPYRSIVWHSERPTAWDRWLASRLVAVGGRQTTFDTPLGDGPGFRVETDKGREEAVLGILTALFGEASAGAASCVATKKVTSGPLPFQPYSLAVAEPPTAGAPPTWFALAPGQAFVGGSVWPLPGPRHAVLDGGHVRTLQVDGYGVTYDWPSRAQRETATLVSLMPIGRSCAAFASSAWWVVDPERGVLKSSAEPAWVPRLEWMGVTSDGHDELVLAAADQQIVVVDVPTRTERFRFPAAVTPSRMDNQFGECTQLIRGRGWIGVFQAARNRLDVYADPGRRLGSLAFDRLGLPWVWAVAGSEAFLATGQASQVVTTLELDFSRCGTGPDERDRFGGDSAGGDR
jgi:hypothetical protein